MTRRRGWWSWPLVAGLLLACGAAEGDVFALEVGRCLDDPGVRNGVEEVELVACEGPHDFEVFASIDLPDGAYPGDREVADTARTSCRGTFAAYVGVEEAVSELATAMLVPNEEGWQAGDRQVVCLLYGPDARLEGSVRGTQR